MQAERQLKVLAKEVIACRTLFQAAGEYCRVIGEEKRRAYRDWVYWAKPVPGFGDPKREAADHWIGARSARG